MPIENRWIWPFELLERIGRGGMGEVYKARFVKNDRIVAVKLLPDGVTDETVLARFEREVGLLREMRHPHIVHTFGGTTDGGEGAQGKRFYAMEYLPGGTLQDLLDRDGRLPPEAVVNYARQICAALAFAHERGVVHRDLKPGNFLLAAEGALKLADFGLAAVREGSKLTAEGRTMGTFRYMAPEQIRGKPPACPQTDLYALGVVLFELLTGRPPFRGETPAETLQMHLKQPPPRVVAHEPHCPPALDALVADLLEKRIEDRPATAGEVGARLATMGEEVALRSRSPTVDLPTRSISGRTATGRADADDLVSPPPPSPAAGPTGVKWVAVAALGLLAVLLPWAASGRAAADALDRAEGRWIAVLNGPAGAFPGGGEDRRVAAARTLGELGEGGSANYAALLAGLGSDDPAVRAAAAAALVSFPSRRAELKGVLTKRVREDSEERVRSAADRSLRELFPQSNAATPADATNPAGRGSTTWAWVAAGLLLAAAGWVGVKG